MNEPTVYQGGYTDDNTFAIRHCSQGICMDVDFQRLVTEITDNPHFSEWWGALRGQHHDFDGGLAKHTWEVIQLCFKSREILGLKKEIDAKELFLSALYHDVGKMWDYMRNPLCISVEQLDVPRFIASPHKRLIHHISRSAIIWSNVCVNTSLYEKYHDIVLHNILSHHGSREWGSPVAPNTRAAWLLHLCDGISARMDDCDRLDLVKGKPH
jgi:23S rRNA maturation-related 3'-5' exoribonuclease YhaM